MTRIGIIVGTTRPERRGGAIAGRVADVVRATSSATVDLIDLRDVELPFMDEPEEPSSGVYHHAHTRSWASRVRELDALIVVTAEYNGSFPAPLKNALDTLGPEWADLPTGIVAYGNTSSGARAASALLPVLLGLSMIPRGSVLLGLRSRLNPSGLEPTAADDEAIARLATRVLAFSRASTTTRVSATA